MSNPKKSSSFHTLQQVSSGGIVFRDNGPSLEFVIIQSLPERRWQLPKGIVDDGETPEEAALREVREETGVVAKILDQVETIEYWYFSKNKDGRIRYHKFVHFFLMRYMSGNVADHDDEVEEARWVSVQDGLSMLAFKSERETVDRAVGLLKGT